MQDPDKTRSAVREAVSEIIGRYIGDEEALVSSGLIDSLAVLKLISKIEQKLAVRISSTGLQPDDFDTVGTILETLQRTGIRA